MKYSESSCATGGFVQAREGSGSDGSQEPRFGLLHCWTSAISKQPGTVVIPCDLGLHQEAPGLSPGKMLLILLVAAWPFPTPTCHFPPAQSPD